MARTNLHELANRLLSQLQDSARDGVFEGKLRAVSAEAAKILRVSPKTVSRWAKEGKLPHVVTLGGHRRCPSTAIHQLADRLEML